MKDVVVHLSEDEMLQMICTDYPEYRCNSEEWGRIMPIRRDLAEGMFFRHMISVVRAAELADVTEQQFMDDLYRRGVKRRAP